MFHETHTHTHTHTPQPSHNPDHMKHVDVNTSCMKMQGQTKTSTQLHLITDCNCLHSYLLTSLLLFFSCFSPSFTLQKPKQNHAPDVLHLININVTCRLNTFQEEPQKLKIFFWTMNVSEEYCNLWQMNHLEVILCTHFCMASLHCSHLFLLKQVLFETANAFAACLIFFFFSCFPLPLLCSSPPFSLWLFYLPSFGL